MVITSGDGSRGEPLIREFRTSTPRSRREKPNAMAIVSARLAPRTVLAWTCGRINRRLPSHPRQIACSGILPAVMLGETRDRTPAPAPPTRVCPDALHVAVMARTYHVDDTGSGRRKKKA